jgi:hypothetical protein
LITAKGIKQTLIALVLIAAGAGLAHMYVVSQTYYPVVRIDSPDGLVFIAVQNPVRERRACGAANERFLDPIKQLCPKCKVSVARCERVLEPYESAVFEGKAVKDHQVAAPGLRLTISGPAVAAKDGCELMAGTLRKMGAPAATCVSPKTP